ncbi:MAG: aldo/keto reductase [Clostridiales bacterium]|nr:aldo/keto reductase [Clostridiales bacterium]
MLYRPIGKTGKKASIIGLGCEHLDGTPYQQVESTIHAALEGGINYMDVFMPGETIRRDIAKALGPRRKDVYLQAAVGSTDINQQYDISRDLPTVQKYFEDCLRIFGGYIDFGFLFFVDTIEDYQKIFDNGLADYIQKLKQQGDIAHIGFSSHNPEIALKMVNTGLPEMMMFSINLAFDLAPSNKAVLDSMFDDWQGETLHQLDPVRMELYRVCEQKGVGISVMKTLGAGKLISPQHTPFTSPMSVNQCIHYALSRPAVYTTLLGCKTPQEIQDSLTYLSATNEQKDYSPFLSQLQSDFSGKCVYCSHCLPSPSEIDIAAVNKYLDIALLDPTHIPSTIKAHYQALANGGDTCIACGSCESRCPFNVSIIDNMAKAAELLG